MGSSVAINEDTVVVKTVEVILVVGAVVIVVMVVVVVNVVVTDVVTDEGTVETEVVGFVVVSIARVVVVFSHAERINISITDNVKIKIFFIIIISSQYVHFGAINVNLG